MTNINTYYIINENVTDETVKLQYISTSFNPFQSISKYSKVICLIFVLLFYPFISVYPQYPDSLNHYLETAIKNNPVVLQKYAEYQAALERIPQAAALPDPELSAGIFLSPMELLMGRQIANLRLMQMFPWFGTLSAASDEMSLMANATYEAFRDSRLQLIYDVQKMWYQMQSVALEIEISNENLEILRSLERIALSRFKTPVTGGISGSGVTGSISAGTAIPSATSPGTMQGMGGMQTGSAGTSAQPQGNSMQGASMGSTSQGSGLADLYGLQSDIIQLENSKYLLESQLKTSKVKFNSYLNRPTESTVTLPPVMETVIVAIDTNSALDTVLLHNPMLAMAEYERKSLEAREKMSDRMGYPMIGLGIDYSVIGKSNMSESEMNGKDMLMPMISRHSANQPEKIQFNENVKLNN